MKIEHARYRGAAAGYPTRNWRWVATLCTCGVRDPDLELRGCAISAALRCWILLGRFSTLYQELQGRLRWQRERALALEKTVA